jgi:EAL domain-containing protein (putative c-di-GMP-specific phosphodiesterase class I)
LFLDKILKDDNFFHHYQPIYDIQNNDIIGYEGLFRTFSNLKPEDVFLNAKRKKMLYELDSRSIHKATLSYINVGNSLRNKNLFLNVFPTTIENPWFYSLITKIINENHISSQQIILEINEGEIFNFKKLKESIERLKNLGIRIALDDCGKGQSSMKSIIELNPDFIKLDQYFADGLVKSLKKQNVLLFLLEYGKKFNSQLIVEGIEDEQSLRILKNIGIRYAQGFFLGKPSKLS